MFLDNKLIKKLIILGFCIIFIVFVTNIDESERRYSPEQNGEELLLVNSAWIENMTSIMRMRKEELERNCEHLGLNIPGNDSLHKPNVWEFLINHEHHLVWCNVFKAASTSWMYNFNILAGYSPKFLRTTREVPLQLARKRYPRPSIQELRKALINSTSFLIVRHPLERLLSGYRDKIEFAIPNTYHHKLGTAIITKYREEKKTVEKPQYNSKNKRRPTFPEFVKYLFDLYKNKYAFDMHWTPITEFCTPCQVKFDIIMKFETLQDDQNYLIQSRNLQKWINPQWKNPSKGKSNTANLVEKYYSQLTKSQIEQLYSIYKYDFQLFGYSLNNYLKYGL